MRDGESFTLITTIYLNWFFSIDIIKTLYIHIDTYEVVVYIVNQHYFVHCLISTRGTNCVLYIPCTKQINCITTTNYYLSITISLLSLLAAIYDQYIQNCTHLNGYLKLINLIHLNYSIYIHVTKFKLLILPYTKSCKF